VAWVLHLQWDDRETDAEVVGVTGSNSGSVKLLICGDCQREYKLMLLSLEE